MALVCSRTLIPRNLRQRVVDLICRTAVYVIRTHSGVGGEGRKVLPYPD
jgi:hypothetical protein